MNSKKSNPFILGSILLLIIFLLLGVFIAFPTLSFGKPMTVRTCFNIPSDRLPGGCIGVHSDYQACPDCISQPLGEVAIYWSGDYGIQLKYRTGIGSWYYLNDGTNKPYFNYSPAP